MSTDFLEWDLNSIPEQQPIDPQKGLVTCKKASITDAKSTRKGLNLMFIVDNHDTAPPIWDTRWLPMEGDDPAKANVMLGMLRDAFKGLGYDFSQITSIASLETRCEELVDLQGEVSIGFEPADEENGYPAKNTIKAFLNK